ARVLGFVRKARRFQRESRLVHEGLKLSERLGGREGLAPARADAYHTDRAAMTEEGHVDGAGAVRPRAQARRLAVLEGPAAQRKLALIERGAPLGPADPKRPVDLGQEHRDVGAEDL